MNAPGGAGMVSVIMIFRDAERFIEEAIASVFSQTYPHWELLLVDDGSEDGSTTISRRYAADHRECIRYLEHPGHANRGMSASRNLGLAAARGAYVAFLDADDVFLPERLARHVAVLARRPEVDMVQSRYQRWYSWQQEGPWLDSDHIGPSIEIHGVIAPPICLSLLLAVPAIAPGICNISLRREWVLAAGGFEERFRGLFEDAVFYAKVYLRGRILVIPDVLARYRRHDDACTRRDRGAAQVAARLEFISWLDEHLSVFEPVDPALLQTLRTQLAAERAATSRPLPSLQRRLSAFANDLLFAILPVPAYLALVRLRRTYEARSAARRLAEVIAAVRPSLLGEAQP